MQKRTPVLLLGAMAALAVALCAYFFLFQENTNHWITPERELTLMGTVLMVAVADTPQERERGLSGTAGLSNGEGMLFIFEHDGQHSFWMKDMRYAIDIIWLSQEKRVVHIEKSVLPDTFPQAFTPPTPARYVLEVPAGFSEVHTLTIGTEASF